MFRALLLPLVLVLSAPGLAQAPITSKLAKHALFSRLALTSAGETGPRLRLLIETPRRPSATHDATATGLFAPWMAAVDQVFHASYITPNTLERREELPELGVILIANGASFSNAQRYQTRPDHLADRCLYVEDPGVIVGQWNERMSRVPDQLVREPVLWRVVDGLFNSYYRGSGDSVKERWVVEGVAGYLTAADEETTPADLESPPANAAALERTLALLKEPATLSLVLPLEVLVASSEPGKREQVGGSRARDAGATLDRAGVQQLFRDQAALWVHYLERGEGGRFVSSWRHYVAKALHDNGSPEELARTLGASLADLDEGFRAHLELLSGSSGPGGPVTVSEEPILHPDLVQPPIGADGVLADAMGRAALGDLERALAYLEAGLRVMRGVERGRLAAERDRLRVVRDTREAYLEGLAGDRKRRLRWTAPGGESGSALVQSYEDGRIVLAKNKLGQEGLMASELTASDLARSMGSKVTDYGPAWITSYLSLLSGDVRWDKKLDTGDGEGAALAAATELPALAAEGGVRARLSRLARSPLPVERSAIRVTLDELKSLAAAPAAREAHKGLRALAVQVLGAQWQSTGLEERLNGKVTSLGGGKVKIVYEFDEPGELEDFLPVEGYLVDRAVKLPKLGEVSKPGWTLRGGNLEGQGFVALRHMVGLQTPIVLDYQLAYGRSKPNKALNATILVAVCDDMQGGYVGAWDLFDLDSIDPTNGYVRTAYEEGERLIQPARTVTLRLEHAGPKASLKVDGKVKREIAVGRRRSGTTLLWLHADAIMAVRRLEIRGTLAQGEDDPAWQAWLAAELSGLGL